MYYKTRSKLIWIPPFSTECKLFASMTSYDVYFKSKYYDDFVGGYNTEDTTTPLWYRSVNAVSRNTNTLSYGATITIKNILPPSYGYSAQVETLDILRT